MRLQGGYTHDASATEKTSLDVQTKDESTKPKDTYTELIKLDDLHKRGILTDAEFEAQKKKLLEAQ